MDASLFQSLEWRCIGPFRGGRVSAVAGHPTQRETFYFGGCGGGVWKTTSAGAYWENISDGFFTTAAIGAIAVSASDPNVIYVGTGESSIRSNVSHGDGVYKSTDGGRHWQNVGLAPTRYISDIQIHPQNPDIVYVGALGHAWGTNPERGVYRTMDGGSTWQLVLHKSERAGVADLSLDPSNPRVIYATIWQGQRHPHTLDSGGEDSGLWRSLDGGETWDDITRKPGLPAGVLGRCGVAASPAKPGRVWALIEAEDGALFRSEDYGETWQRLSEDRELRGRPWYYMRVFADTMDADTLWILNSSCLKSIDGGQTFATMPTPHGDNHDLWIDPHDSNRLIEGNDGGATITFDGGNTWTGLLSQPTAQFYHAVCDDQVPYHVYGSQQDNWAMRVPSIDFEGAISWKDYVEPGGGESGYIAISPQPPHRVFGGGIGTGAGHGRLVAWDPQTGQKRNVTVWPEVHSMGVGGAGAEVLKYRFQWTFPVEFSPHAPNTLYICSNYVHRSTDEGTSWETISPDLTRNDPDKLHASGGAITDDNSGAEIYCTIFAFRESPHEAGVFWTGSDDGLVHLSRDGGKTWQNVTPPSLPEWSQISIIEPSPFDAGSVYVAAMRYKHDDYRPFIFKTDDYGETWRELVNGIPADEYVRVVRADPHRSGLLYAGTETGIYLSFDDGASWQRFNSNLPVAPIHDLVIKGTDLVAATHGRSFWILDDLTPLHQWPAEIEDKAVHLFQPRPTTPFRIATHGFGQTPGIVNYLMTGPVTVAYRPVETTMGTLTESFLDAGKNPPEGVIIHYVLRERPEGEVRLRILDQDGAELVAFSSASERPPRVPIAAGANRFVWNMREAPPARLADAKGGKSIEAMIEEWLESSVAPRVLPGTYRVELSVGDSTMTESFQIEPDPRLPVTLDDLTAQYQLKAAIRDRITDVSTVVNQIRALRPQIDQWIERAQGHAQEESITQSGNALREELESIEGTCVNLNTESLKPGGSKLREKLIGLSGMIDESDHAPTAGGQEVYTLLASEAAAVWESWQGVVSEDLPVFTRRVQEANLPLIVS